MYIRVELCLYNAGRSHDRMTKLKKRKILDFSPLKDNTIKTDRDEIRHISVDHGFTLACQIWPGSV